MNKIKLTGLVAAAHTPFYEDGSLNLAVVEKQAEQLHKNGVGYTFIGGSTGESHSLTLEERRQLTQRWLDVVRGSNVKVIVHAGSNCIADAKSLAAQAQSCGAIAISALAPCYFKPRTLNALVDCCAEVASAAPQLPFYFYDIPALTGVSFPMLDFLALASERISTLSGIKWTNSDLFSYQLCLNAQGGWDLPWGNDEYFLAAMSLGSTGAVGSTFNFASPIYLRMMNYFAAGDMASARKEQLRSARLVQTLAAYGYLAAAKTLMGFLGVEVGPARLPNSNLSPVQKIQLRTDLEKIGYFEWSRP